MDKTRADQHDQGTLPDHASPVLRPRLWRPRLPIYQDGSRTAQGLPFFFMDSEDVERLRRREGRLDAFHQLSELGLSDLRFDPERRRFSFILTGLHAAQELSRTGGA